jgi:hypothetical protein
MAHQFHSPCQPGIAGHVTGTSKPIKQECFRKSLGTALPDELGHRSLTNQKV